MNDEKRARQNRTLIAAMLGALGGFLALARWLDGRSSVGSAEATLAMAKLV
jgi:hypothetical protein